MGKVKEKLPTPDTNPVDGDKLIKATKPKKCDKNMTSIKDLESDMNTLGSWVADIDDELQEISKLVIKMANRMGFK